MDYKLTLPLNYVKPILPGRDEWLAELRKPDLKQGRGWLCKDGAMCCLGVLCKVQGRLAHFLDAAEDERVGDRLSAEYLDISNPVQHFLAGNGRLPALVTLTLEGDEEVDSLADANDLDLTFTQIADIIEAVWSHAPKNWDEEGNLAPAVEEPVAPASSLLS